MQQGPEKGIEPQIRAEPFRFVDTALKDAEGFDLYIFDGAPHSSHLNYALRGAPGCT